jgi:hypothetical protein
LIPILNRFNCGGFPWLSIVARSEIAMSFRPSAFVSYLVQRPANPFRYFNSLPVIIRLAVMMYVKYPLSLRNVEDLLAERGIDVCYETVRFWWNRFGPMSPPRSAASGSTA